jgi:hypothetical protein
MDFEEENRIEMERLEAVREELQNRVKAIGDERKGMYLRLVYVHSITHSSTTRTKRYVTSTK